VQLRRLSLETWNLKLR